MLDVRHIEKVYIACHKADMRKSINGLAVIVQESFKLDPFENAIFLFYNGDKTRAKLLKWDHNGLSFITNVYYAITISSNLQKPFSRHSVGNFKQAISK